ncbi:MAG: 50S ribosomal protein L24e [Candidatus Aenigmarchaeota archaeon]|nr:50S ribosomal protein L24e [Candidatus Aenigmarchaeota archaeon]
MRCTFCNTNIPKGTGKMYVKVKGAISYFCSSKCEKNLAMGRVSKYVKWAKSAKA